MDDFCKRSGQIPVFGDWEYANEMPITQYFESARQAGLLRYSSSSGDSDNPYNIRGGGGDLYAVGDHFKKHSRNYVAPTRKARVREKRGSNVKEMQKMQVKKVCDVTKPPRKHSQKIDGSRDHNHNNSDKLKQQQQQQPHDDVVAPARPRIVPARPPKAVDEDLYKIPPELLHSSKRKKMPGFFSCLVPACAS